MAVAGSGAAGRRQRRRQSGGGGGSMALALAWWQRRRRRHPNPNHPCHGATNSAINCSRTAWQCSSVPLRNEGRRWIAGGSVTPVCHIPVNRVDEVLRFVGISTKKFKTLITNNRTLIIYNLNFKYSPEPIIYNQELYIMKPQGSSINKPGSKYSPGPIIYNWSLFETGATDLSMYFQEIL